jgi:asparagine synthetase B (glutamine-hydrolysing)
VRRAVEDGATVPIYYEARIVKVDLDPVKVSYLDEEFEEITEGQEEDEKRRSASRWSQIEALVGTDERIEEVARDIVEHFEQRQKGFEFEGKAMIVCMSRRICARLYQAIVALRPDWHDDADEGGAIKVVMTGSAADELLMQPHIRNKPRRRRIEGRFKDPAGPLKIARPSQPRPPRAKTLARPRTLGVSAVRSTPSTIGETANGAASTAKTPSAIGRGSSARSRRSSTPSRSQRSLARRAFPSPRARAFVPGRGSHTRGIGLRF